MGTRNSPARRKAWSLLSRHGLLLVSDADLPSVAGLVAGEPVRGSWWSHPRSHEIFAVSEALSHHPDVLVAKLLAGKVTFVHRKLWPALLAVALAGSEWQLRALPAVARTLLRTVTRQGSLELAAAARGESRSTLPQRQAARALERRLLLHSREVHTESGSHARILESWQHWMKRMDIRRPDMTMEAGMSALEQAAASLSGTQPFDIRLPWSPARRRSGAEPA